VSESAQAGPAGPPLRIVVADDQASVREGLVLLLGLLPDIDVVASAANGEQAIALVAQHQPDAILLDLHMPVLDGIAATARLTAEHPDVAIVVLTTYSDNVSVLAALRAGARSFLTKDADRADIAQALHSAAHGLSVLDPAAHAILLAAARDRGPTEPDNPANQRSRADLPDGLTPREAEILGLIAAGASNGDIAARLVLSNHTIKSHINRIFAKTRSPDRAAVARYAREHGLGPAPDRY
jgi:DNA-binding NarL/FixJ family response regulator